MQVESQVSPLRFQCKLMKKAKCSVACKSPIQLTAAVVYWYVMLIIVVYKLLMVLSVSVEERFKRK